MTLTNQWQPTSDAFPSSKHFSRKQSLTTSAITSQNYLEEFVMGRITSSKTQLKPDPKFDSLLASKFINCLMWDGKKTIAQSVFYNALDEIKKRVPDVEPIDVFEQAVENVKPHIEVRSKRVVAQRYSRQKGPPNSPNFGWWVDCSLQPRRCCHDQTWQHAPYGWSQQSVRSLCLVTTEQEKPLC